MHSIISSECQPGKESSKELGDRLIIVASTLKKCSRPNPLYLDKIYSNLHYRANRLIACGYLFRDGNTGFNCSREIKKILRSHVPGICDREIGSIKNILTTFEKSFSVLEKCSDEKK